MDDGIEPVAVVNAGTLEIAAERDAYRKRCRELEDALQDTPKLMQFMDSWICEMMDNETICTALREMKEWDALCAFQDMLKEQRNKARQALGDSQ